MAMKHIKIQFLYSLAILLFNSNTIIAQNCSSAFNLSTVTSKNTIEWDKFPDFSLPFKIIYSGPRFGDNNSRPLRHGFSHLATFSGNEPGSLPLAQRANLWYGVATNSGVIQPWADNTLRSPWGNDTLAYRNYWDNYAKLTEADIICFDIERMQREDRDIIGLKSNSLIPKQYTSLTDSEFIRTYKKDMRWWYSEALVRFKAIRPKTTITSYSDVPIRNTWLNITANSWQDWTTNPARTHYLVQSDDGKIGGRYYNLHDILSPSPYYYYGYDNPFGKDYLSYLLFHIEVNRAWSNKPIIPFVWLRIHDSYDPNTPLITPFMAEATAIFPFFSGASGLWLWENPFIADTKQENYATYEHFIYGLYRLSQFKYFFEGEHELISPQSARDNMELQNPIWRGVVKNNEIAIAAHNPYAKDDEQTTIVVNYKDWLQTIVLKGKEVYLCKFDLNKTITSIEPTKEIVIYSNPTDNILRFTAKNLSGEFDIKIFSVGQTLLYEKTINIIETGGINAIYLPITTTGMYIAEFRQKGFLVRKKIVILK